MAIQLKGSNVVGIIPDVTELQERELGINTATGTLYTNDGTQIIEIDTDKINTGLEVDGSGWRLIGQNVGNAIGLNAIELSADGGVGFGASGVDSIAIGTESLASATNSIAIGNGTSVVSTNSIGIGQGNSVGGGINVEANVIGSGNTAINTDNLNLYTSIYGGGNTISGYNSIVFGEGNSDTSVTDDEVVMIGIGLVGGDKKTIIGKFNDPLAVANSVYEIGGGTSGGDKTIFGIDANGVSIAPEATPANITSAGNQALVTVGYLGDPSTLGVSSVNTQTGVVVLSTDDVATANDKLYITQVNTDLIGTNASDISTLQLGKEDNLIYGTTGQVMATNGSANGYVWVDNSILTLSDTPVTMGTDGQYLKVNVAGTALEFADFSGGVVGLDLVENMSPQMLADDALLPDAITPNAVYTKFSNLQIGKMESPGIPDIAQIGSMAVVDTSNGIDAYTTTWTDFTFSELYDVETLDVGVDENKFLRLGSSLGVTDTVVYTNIDTDMVYDDRGVQQTLTTTLNAIEGDIANHAPVYLSATLNTTAVANDYIFADTVTTGAFQVTLPASPVAGDVIHVLDVKSNFATASVTVVQALTAETIMGLAQNMVLNVDNKEYKLIYTGSDWRVI